MQMTTIKVSAQTKKQLDTMRSHTREPYDLVLRKVLYIAKNAKRQPQLSKRTLEAIERARAEFERGEFYTAEEARQLLEARLEREGRRRS
jgi:predicted transcriptional regulator